MADVELESKPGVSQDDALLLELGYKQDFKRDLNLWSATAFCFSIMGVVASVSGTMLFPFTYGGHVGIVWGWFVASVFVYAVAASLAELCSAMPTSGGLYYWSARLAPPRYAALASWLTAWMNLLGQFALVCSIEFTTAAMIADAVSISSDFTTFYSDATKYGLTVALLTLHLIICSSATHVLAKLNYLYVLINIGTFIAVLVVLGVMAPKQPASVAFGSFENNSDWSSKGFAWLLSMTAAMWSLTGYDAAAHVAEETTNAAVVGPWAMFAAVAGTSTLGWALSIMFSFCIPDPAQLLESQLYMPIAQLYYNVVGKHGALVLWSLTIIIQLNTAAAQVVDASRVAYAFARDGGLPFSSKIAYVHPWTKSPINAVLFTVVGAAIIGLLSLSATAMTALASTAVIGLYISYSIPIFLRITAASHTFEPGPWSLGKYSIPIACIACAWVLFITVILFFPAEPGPTPDSMNWAILLVGAIMGGSILFWFASARHWFKGPLYFFEASHGTSQFSHGQAPDGTISDKPETGLADFIPGSD
ncbi:hypothetical protein MYAM1_003701 [Malassezia yamatoensis]|uniref:Amino acid transporter n=1 Tax=Malassezia yamatoensis TaxID=253288 RepID=A0AAJ5Z252_9BASI|nr:hypothetical protein MYAM1_003701 [Malassezia yamatoensis]